MCGVTVWPFSQEGQRSWTIAAGVYVARVETDRYRWIALSNTTLGMLIATINSSIVLIALPDVFRGIHLDPLRPGNSGYLLWMMMAYMVATAVLVVSFGRIGDMFGRVRMYNAGFAIFTIASVGLAIAWQTGVGAAIWMIAMRLVQGIGGALIMGNASAIIADAFPAEQRGFALGINSVAALAGAFLGLVLGGVLAPIDWRLVFLVSVPFGLLGTVWAYAKLEDRSERHPAKIDLWGNVTFAVGLVLILVSITDALQPYGHHAMGWTNPWCYGKLIAGTVVLGLFAWIERRVADPMFRLELFRIRAFTAGNLATFLAAMGRGGLMFMLIIWLQGIWLPLHGYSFERTPLWAGIYMLPLTVGFLIAGPVSGYLSDRLGARPFATGGMLVAAATFGLFELLPVDFQYAAFAGLLLLIGMALGLFSSPNQSGIMNSLPPHQRGAGAGMMATFQNSAQVLSIGVFFTLMVIGLTATLPGALERGLAEHHMPRAHAERVAHVPPVSLLFASFLGYNPMQQLVGDDLAELPKADRAALTSRTFFPRVMSAPFQSGLRKAFDFALFACLVAAAASWLRGGRYVHAEGIAEVAARHPAESVEGELALPPAGEEA
jgi:MFS family permease